MLYKFIHNYNIQSNASRIWSRDGWSCLKHWTLTTSKQIRPTSFLKLTANFMNEWIFRDKCAPNTAFPDQTSEFCIESLPLVVSLYQLLKHISHNALNSVKTQSATSYSGNPRGLCHSSLIEILSLAIAARETSCFVHQINWLVGPISGQTLQMRTYLLDGHHLVNQALFLQLVKLSVVMMWKDFTKMANYNL